jgi:importin subunit alpha-6/7
MVHCNILIQTHAVRIIGNIASGENKQTGNTIEVGALKHVYTLLNGNNNSLKEECCLISNIAAGNQIKFKLFLIIIYFNRLLKF